jgi:adenylate cyclase
MLLTLSWTGVAYGQTGRTKARADSLLTVLQATKADTARIRLMAEVAKALEVKAPDRAIGYADRAIALSAKVRYDRHLPGLLVSKAGAFYNLNDRSNAALWADRALALGADDPAALSRAYRLKGLVAEGEDRPSDAIVSYRAMLDLHTRSADTVGMETGHYIIATVFSNMGMYPEAISAMLSCIRLNELLRRERTVTDKQVMLGSLYIQQGEFRNAVDILGKAHRHLEELQDKDGMSFTLNNMAAAYYSLGMADSAEWRYEEALRLNLQLGDSAGVALCHNNLGIISMDRKQFVEAADHFRTALDIQRVLGDKDYLANTLSSMGDMQLRTGRFAEARASLTEAVTLANEVNDRVGRVECYRLLARLDSLTGNWRGAYLHHMRYTTWRDSISNEENTRKVVQAQLHYEFDRKEDAARAAQQIKDAESEREMQRQSLLRNVFMAASVLMLLAAGIFMVQRNRIAKERKRSDELLLNILPGEVAEELKQKGEAEARLMEHVTVLFTDFKGFTAMSEQMTPKELVRDLHDCFTVFDRICEQHGIEKIKTIGDAYMAAGGLPTPCTDHAQRVVRAALEMAEVVAQGRTRKMTQGRPYFEIRIGIHTGPVVAGIVGVKKFQYDIWGDTVNTASRMESSGEVGRVNISEATYALVKDDFQCEYRGELEAKGKGRMGMWFVNANA